ncbi:MAG: hypothetical protein C5B43_04870 [Verrucomicrobia bacterium]|nr:MAG: hypothetical protein C5B43_04870 [Verrucomicrobiota bacterium]
MVQAIKSKTHARKAQPKAASANRKAVKAGKSKTSAKASYHSSGDHRKSKSRTKAHDTKITATLSKIAKEHNLENAIKSAMIAMIEKIKF